MLGLCYLCLLLLAYSAGAQTPSSASPRAAGAAANGAPAQARSPAIHAPAASTVVHSDGECRIISGPSALGAQGLLLGELPRPHRRPRALRLHCMHERPCFTLRQAAHVVSE
jgi:hypothetical protein